MADFSHFKKLDVSETSEAEYVFDDVVIGRASDGTEIYPSIWFRPMVDSNAAYLNERVRLAVERAEKANKETKSQRRKRVLSAEQVEEDRELDRILMARTCAIRWGVPPKDVNGDEPEFSEENCLAFLQALPGWIFDGCRGFASNIYNFVDRNALIGDAANLGNFSQPG
jgi:hypothetical protein